MIDFERIRRERTGKRVFVELLANAPQLFLMVYGLKMLATQHGQMLQSVKSQVYHRLHLSPVHGTLAAIVGFQYLAFGVFIYMSNGRPPVESRGRLWRLGRAGLRWGALVGASFCFFEADKLATGRGVNVSGLPDHLLLKAIGSIGGILVSWFFLLAMYQREQVKRELANNSCEPIHILWCPGAYWLGSYVFTGCTGFRVIYFDRIGAIHKGYCLVYRSIRVNRRFGNRCVQWLADELTTERPTPEVWADSEILRAKLGFGEASLERDTRPDEPEETRR